MAVVPNDAGHSLACTCVPAGAVLENVKHASDSVYPCFVKLHVIAVVPPISRNRSSASYVPAGALLSLWLTSSVLDTLVVAAHLATPVFVVGAPQPPHAFDVAERVRICHATAAELVLSFTSSSCARHLNAVPASKLAVPFSELANVAAARLPSSFTSLLARCCKLGSVI